MKQSKFSPGWDEKRVQSVIDYYENQTEDAAVAEDEAAFRSEFITRVEVPTELVSVVRKLVTRHNAQNHQQNNKTFHASKGRFVLGLPRSTQWASLGYLAREIGATVSGKAELKIFRIG